MNGFDRLDSDWSNSAPATAFTRQHEIHSLKTFQQFNRLTPETKICEINKLLPLLQPFTQDFSYINATLGQSIEHLKVALEDYKLSQKRSIRENKLAARDEKVEQEKQVDNDNTEEVINQNDPFIIAKCRKLNKRVTLNVGGVCHEVLWRMLEQLPHSRLGLLSRATTHDQIMSLCSDYSLVDNEFFFYRHPRSFNTILNFYRTGKLHIADEMCTLALGDDLEYWMLDEYLMEDCCSERFFSKRDLVVEEMEETAAKLEVDDEEDFGTGMFAKYQKQMWDLIEKPDTSPAAQVISVLSTLFVAVSIVGMTISTLEILQYKDAAGNTIDNPTLAMIETVCIAWFTLEYFIRLAGAPGKWDFLKDGMNVVDVLAILPFFVTLFFMGPSTDNLVVDDSVQMTTLAPDTGDVEDESSGMEDILQVFRIFKLARVLKLARHSPGLQAIAYTLQNSYKELGLLIFLICISGFIFASLAYFIEIDEESGFTSIPTAFYWVVITMTTIGYGDIAPTTGLGKLVGSMCAVSGVLVLSLPIPIIAGNFEAFHKNQQKNEKAVKGKKKLTAAKIKEFETRQQFCNNKGTSCSLPGSPECYCRRRNQNF